MGSYFFLAKKTYSIMRREFVEKGHMMLNVKNIKTSFVIAMKIREVVKENHEEFKKNYGTMFNYRHGIQYVNEK